MNKQRSHGWFQWLLVRFPAVLWLAVSLGAPAGLAAASFAAATQPITGSLPVAGPAAGGGAAGTTAAPADSFTLDQFHLEASSITGGEELRGTVRFQGVAPAGGAVVTLATDHPEIAELAPSTVTVTAGGSEGDVLIYISSVQGDTSVTLSANYGGVTKSSVLLVRAAALASLQVWAVTNPWGPEIHGRVGGAAVAVAAISFNGPVARNATVTLTHDHAEIVTMPDQVVVPRGANDAGVSIQVPPVLAPTPVQITASYAGITRSVVLQVSPVALGQFRLKGDAVSGGVTTDGEVVFAGEPPAGTQIAVSTERPDLISAPATVEVAAGQWVVDIPVATKPVTTATRARVFLSFNGQRLGAWLTLLPARLSSLTLVLGPDMNEDQPLAVLTLTGPAPPGGIVVSLGGAGPTNSVTVPAGATLVATPVRTQGGTTGAAYGGVQIPARWELPLFQGNSPVPDLVWAVITRQPWVVGGRSLVGTLSVADPAPEGGMTFQLSSSDERFLRVPGTVTITAGQQSVSVPILTSPVSTDQLVTIYTRGGYARGLWVVPSGLFSVSFDSGRVIGGRSVVGTVTLTDPAPTGGQRVPLLSSDPAVALVPPAVEVSAGATTAAFPITTAAVAEATSVGIVAASEGQQRVAALRVVPPALASLLVSPSPLHAGEPATGTVTLSDPAPAGGLVIDLWTDSVGYCVLPETVIVSPGAALATFPVLTDPVETVTAVEIFAAYGTDFSGPKEATLVLHPS